VQGIHFFFLLLEFQFIQARAENFHRHRPVLVLRSLVLTRDHDAGREMGEAHRGIGFVDVLPAGAAGAIRVDAQIGFVNFHLDGVIDFRINEQRSKRSMTPRIGVERGDPH
jgi:hypothetical protein